MSQLRDVNFMRAAWIKALRSGTYQQGRENLRTVKGHPRVRPDSKHPEGHCVLGVMCEVFFAFTPGWGWRWGDGAGYDHANLVPPYADLPPAPILEAFGMPPGFAFDVAKMGDRGYTFTRLADHLEAVWVREQADLSTASP
jgi:hypothetical protein